MAEQAAVGDPAGKVLVSDCEDISLGAVVEVRARGLWHFAGRVVEVHPPMNLFWAESLSGERRIIELEEYEVYRPA